jgi:hypothetical protein
MVGERVNAFRVRVSLNRKNPGLAQLLGLLTRFKNSNGGLKKRCLDRPVVREPSFRVPLSINRFLSRFTNSNVFEE